MIRFELCINTRRIVCCFRSRYKKKLAKCYSKTLNIETKIYVLILSKWKQNELNRTMEIVFAGNSNKPKIKITYICTYLFIKTILKIKLIRYLLIICRYYKLLYVGIAAKRTNGKNTKTLFFSVVKTFMHVNNNRARFKSSPKRRTEFVVSRNLQQGIFISLLVFQFVMLLHRKWKLCFVVVVGLF